MRRSQACEHGSGAPGGGAAARLRGVVLVRATAIRREGKEKTARGAIGVLEQRPRVEADLGSYETTVHPELATIVRERVETLWDMGI